VAWHNINLNGTYSFSFEQNPLDLLIRAKVSEHHL